LENSKEIFYARELLERIVTQESANPKLIERWLKFISDFSENNDEEIAKATETLIEQDPMSSFGLQVADILRNNEIIDLLTFLKFLIRRLEYCPMPPKNQKFIPQFLHSELIYWRIFSKTLSIDCSFQIAIEDWIQKCHFHRINSFTGNTDKNCIELCALIRKCFQRFTIIPDIWSDEHHLKDDEKTD
jgi:hypothetical protein